ncbi:MAG: hypothetical protein KC516_01005 [Nanoarchaeota archaeon]|nr:hypothetical protein [Nanoarchaeota archaeon]
MKKERDFREKTPLYRKIGRREFLKYSGKIAGGIAVGGLIGYGVGKPYQMGKEFYNEEVAPLKDKTEKALESYEEKTGKAKKWYHNTKEDLKKLFKGKDSQKKESKKEPKENPNGLEKKVSRKGFFQTFGKLFHNYPVTTGTTTGATIGGATGALKGNKDYRRAKKIRGMGDTIKGQGRKIMEQEERIRYLEEEMLKLQNYGNLTKDQKKELEDNSKELGKLEKNISDEEGRGGSVSLIVLGFLGILFAGIASAIRITGNSVIKENFLKTPLISVVIFLVSLLIVFIGIKIRK